MSHPKYRRLKIAPVPNVGKQKGHKIAFFYRCVCADCDEEGRMVLDARESGTVNCPAGCGSVYYPWRNPLRGERWELKPVVVAHYELEAP